MDPGVEMLPTEDPPPPPPPVMGGVVGPPPPIVVEAEELLLATSDLEVAHMSSIAEEVDVRDEVPSTMTALTLVLRSSFGLC